MSDLRAVSKQALEALEIMLVGADDAVKWGNIGPHWWHHGRAKSRRVIVSLRAALKQTEQDQAALNAPAPLGIPSDDASKLILATIDSNIKALVQKAVEAEREACAKACEQAGINGHGTLAAAALIRTREKNAGKI